MQTITRKVGDFDDLVFEVDLSDYGKDNTDVNDIFFSVKSKLSDADNSLLLKTFSGAGGITFTGTTVLTVNVTWSDTEYSGMTPGGDYEAGLFVKFTGDPKADEHVNTTFKVVLNQKFLKQN
jgi:hypothetical protein